MRSRQKKTKTKKLQAGLVVYSTYLTVSPFTSRSLTTMPPWLWSSSERDNLDNLSARASASDRAAPCLSGTAMDGV